MATKKTTKTEDGMVAEPLMYHPEEPRSTLEGTASEILAFMLNNSGLTKEQYRAMSGGTWDRTLELLESVDRIILTLKLLGYKLMAIPVANYMLSDVESYHFIPNKEKHAALDELSENIVNFRPMSMNELKAFGVTFAKQTQMRALIYERAGDEEAIAKAGLARSREGWKFSPYSQKQINKIKKKAYNEAHPYIPISPTAGKPPKTYSKKEIKYREKVFKKEGRPKAKNTETPIVTVKQFVSETDCAEPDMFFGNKPNEF